MNTQLAPVTIASTTLSADGTKVIVSFNPPSNVSYTQTQLTQQLIQAQSKLSVLQNQASQTQNQLANINSNIANLISIISNIQSQISLFMPSSNPTTSTIS